MIGCEVIFTVRVPVRLSGHDDIDTVARASLQKRIDGGRLSADDLEIDDIIVGKQLQSTDRAVERAPRV